jgi:hypothetical protein
MPPTPDETEQLIATLVEATDSILRGEYTSGKTVINTEEVLSTLAQKINAMVVNLKTAEILSQSEEKTPGILGLMAHSTDSVLDKSDYLLTMIDRLVRNNQQKIHVVNHLSAMKVALNDIVASQSYQDVARQKMEAIVSDLRQVRKWMIETLVILNLNKDSSPENVQKKTELLREVNTTSATGELNQKLVDNLLAEYGF